MAVRAESRLGFLAIALVAIAGSGCGKTTPQPPLVWARSVDAAFEQGRVEHKPVIVYFGAEWDTAWKEMEHVTLANSMVRARLLRGFVNVYVDVSNDEDPIVREMSDRFKMVGEPTFVFHSEYGEEIFRYNEYVNPARFGAALQAITSSHTTAEARELAVARDSALTYEDRLRWKTSLDTWKRDQAERKATLCARDPKRSICS